MANKSLSPSSASAPLVLIAAGGTGGHLYPAIAVAEAIRRRLRDVRVTFVGTGREVERHIVERSGYELIELRVRPLKGKSLLDKLRGVLAIFPALLVSARLVRRLRPALVIGAGGYVSGPFVLAASLSTPTLIMEVNLRPGLTTRWLSSIAGRIACSFEESVVLFGRKGFYSGHPVREEFFAVTERARNLPLSLLIVGGSQGSSVLNRAILDALPALAGRVQIRHQTGVREAEAVAAAHATAGSGARVEAFIDGMAEAFAEADLVVSRAGASTIAEIEAAGRPAVLVPFAAATDNHQELNARALERAGAACVVTEAELPAGRLADRLLELIASPEKRTTMAIAARNLANPRAAEQIAEVAMELMRKGGDRRA